jgi:hypothetical protein
MNSHGGYRRGAGRPSGSCNKSTSEDKKQITEFAKDHSQLALRALIDIATNGRTDAARVAAANSILDRGYGKPSINEKAEITELPPLVIQLSNQ